MMVLATPRFEEQLKNILLPLARTDAAAARSFKLYLDTVLLNLPSKAAKYKPSIYTDDPTVRDVEHQGFTIPFHHDSDDDIYTVLGIFPSN